MDPKETLKLAERELERGEFDIAQEFIDEYRAWRQMGGFNPDAEGDLWALDLERRLSEVN